MAQIYYYEVIKEGPRKHVVVYDENDNILYEGGTSFTASINSLKQEAVNNLDPFGDIGISSLMVFRGPPPTEPTVEELEVIISPSAPPLPGESPNEETPASTELQAEKEEVTEIMGGLKEESEGLKSAVIKLKDAMVVPVVPDLKALLESKLLTKEEIMIKVLMFGGVNTVPGPGMDEETAYEMVYGELQYDENYSLLYPGVVNEEKRKIDKTHPINDKIDEMKKEVLEAVDEIKYKAGEIADASVQLGIEIGAAVVTIASSAVIMPPGSGIPTGFSAVQSVFSSLQAYQTKVMQVIPYLKPLSYIFLLIPSASVTAIVSPVQMAITTIKSTIDGVMPIIETITALKKTLSSPPGVELPGGGGTPAESIELDISATETSISPGASTKLKVDATKGSWDYSYSWSADNDSTFHSTKKKTNVEPNLTTTYTVQVTDSKGSKSNESIIISVVD